MSSFPPPRDTIDHRRQLNATLQRIRRQSMTEERRQEYLSQRRSNYQQRRYVNSSNASPNESTFTASNDTLNSIGENVISRRQEQRRILDRMRRNSMTNDERNTYLERRREAYRKRTQNFATSSNEGIAATTLGQVCRTQTISYQTMSSNFHQWSTSTCQRLTDLNHQGTGNSENNIIFRSQIRPRRYRTLARNFNESQHNGRWNFSNPTICLHCQALLFHGETPQLCCRNGRTKLDQISSPIELQQLYDENNEQDCVVLEIKEPEPAVTGSPMDNSGYGY